MCMHKPSLRNDRLGREQTDVSMTADVNKIIANWT